MSVPSTTDPRTPSVLERAIARAQDGVVSAETVLWVLAASPAVVLSNSPLAASGFPEDPLVVNRGDSRFLALFTHEDHAGGFLAGREAVAVPTIELLRRMPAGVGVVVNPGDPLGFEVPSDGLRGFLQLLFAVTTTRDDGEASRDGS